MARSALFHLLVALCTTTILPGMVGTMAHIRGGHSSPVKKPQDLLKPADAGYLQKQPRPVECFFGDEYHEVGSKWHPNLGPPFNVMYCIECECFQVETKKRRITGKVRCRNVKNDCPIPRCENPILLSNQCCKVCPDNTTKADEPAPDTLFYQPYPSYSSMPHLETGIEDLSGIKRDSYQEIRLPDHGYAQEHNNYEEDERNSRDFAVLMTGQTSGMHGQYSAAVATGRLNFYKKNLYYSFYVEGMAKPPRVLRFLTKEKIIIDELDLHDTSYENATGKVCGVWRRVPRIYRKMIREEDLFVSLLSDKLSEEDGLTGRVARYRALSTEMYTGILAPSNDAQGGGGTVVVSISASTNSVHFNIIYNGIFTTEQVRDVPIGVHLEHEKGSEERGRVLEEHGVAKKPLKEANLMEIRAVFDNAQMRQLSKSKLVLTVFNKEKPSLYIRGLILPRVTCETFETALSASGSTDEHLPVTAGAGFAMLYRTLDGRLSYEITLEGLSSPVKEITFDSGIKKKRKVIEDVTPSFQNGKARGTFAKSTVRDLEMLYAGEIFVNVMTEAHRSELRGPLQLKYVGDSERFNGGVLLRPDYMVAGAPAGFVWLSVDPMCGLRYEFIISGVSRGQTLEFRLIDNFTKREAYIHKNKVSNEIPSDNFEGVVDPLKKKTKHLLYDGRLSMIVRMVDSSQSLLKGYVTEIPMHRECTDMRGYVPGILHDTEIDEDDDNSDETGNEIPKITHCMHDGRIYNNHDVWQLSNCSTCMCLGKRVQCENMRCPAVSCDNPLKPPGECCDQCISEEHLRGMNKSRCTMEGDKKEYLPGSAWHPFLPPFGFSECVTCKCHEHTLKVTCEKKECPLLTCSEHEASKPTPLSCCSVCPQRDDNTNSDRHDTTPRPITTEEVLAAGGCKFRKRAYTNGTEWHPRVDSLGEVKCITCKCLNGETTCRRKQCPKNSCPAETDDCCPNICGGKSTSNPRKIPRRSKRPTTRQH